MSKHPETRPGGRRLPVRARLLLVFSLVTLAFVVLAPGASAARAWCRTDPIVVIDGTLADVYVSGPLTAPLKVTGPTKMIVTVPEGVKAHMILHDLGFLRGYDFKFQYSSELQRTDTGVEVRVEVYVPARDSKMPIKVEFSPRLLGLLAPESVEGTANQWITLETVLERGLL
jgi:hypothetical protein